MKRGRGVWVRDVRIESGLVFGSEELHVGLIVLIVVVLFREIVGLCYCLGEDGRLVIA